MHRISGKKQPTVACIIERRDSNGFHNPRIAGQPAFILKTAKAAANGKRSGGEQERNLFAPDRVLHSGCDVCRDTAQHELAVVILCGVADGVCLGAKKQHDFIGELLQRPLGGGFQKRGQLPADQKQRRKDSAEIIMEQLNRILRRQLCHLLQKHRRSRKQPVCCQRVSILLQPDNCAADLSSR